MAAQPDMRQKIIDDVIEALQGAGGDATIDVRLEGRRVVVVIDPSGDGRRSVAAKPGRPPSVKGTAEPEGAALPDGTADKVMLVLGEKRYQRGLNLKKLARAVGVKEKVALKPVIASLIRAKSLKKVGQLIRRADVEVHPGRKAEGKPKAEKAAGRKAGRPPKVETTPAKNERFTHEAITGVLRAHPPGYSMVELTLKLGARKKSKMQLKPVLAEMMKLSGENQVEKKGPFYRLKNLERHPGRKAGTGGKKAAAPKKAGKRGPGRPPGSKNEKPATAKSVTKGKRGPGRPKGSKNRATKSAKASRQGRDRTGVRPVTDKPAKRGPGRPKGSTNKKTAPPATNADTKARVSKAPRTAKPAKAEATDEKKAEPEPAAAEEPKKETPAPKAKKERSLTELMKAAKARAQADLKKYGKKNHKPVNEGELDESGQIKRELTRVPVEEEERIEAAAAE